MELHQLAYFVAVAEAGSFSAGARQAQVVQSTVSASIARLERELGQPLFERTSRHTHLTEAGRVLLDHARILLAQVRVARDDLASLREGVTGTVVLGSLLSSGSVDLAGLLRSFNRDHPAVSVRVRHLPGGRADRFAAVADGLVDLALVVPPRRPPGWAQIDVVGQIRLGLACAAGDPLARRRRVELASIADRAFVDVPVGWSSRTIADAAFQAAGITRSVAFEVGDLGSALNFVARGMGLGFAPEDAIAARPDVRRVQLAQPPQPSPLAVVRDRRRPASAATRALQAALTAAAISPAP